MDTRAIRPETIEEQLVYWTIVGTWGLWLLGTLYIVGPLVGFILVTIIAARFLGLFSDQPTIPDRIPFAVMLWIACMLAMLLALVVAHLDFELGIGQLIKSSIGWAKGWALLAIFPLAGAMLSIRSEILYRATSLLAAQSLVLVPLFIFAGLIGLPGTLYVSPLSMIGGPGPEFFDVTLYTIDGTNGHFRWRFFSPWATASAFLSVIGLIFALQERHIGWKIVGIAAAIAICIMSGSRLGIVAMPFILIAVYIASKMHRPEVFAVMGVGIAATILMADFILPLAEDMQDTFNSARAASSRVRETLNAIGYHRWYDEAFLFGHGTVQPGSHLVEYMPIGSHHTWYGLLFVKGIIGFVALAIPLMWTLIELTLKAQGDRVARAGLAVFLTIAVFSFADNLEIVAYLIWPGLLLIGICFQRPVFNPYIEPSSTSHRPVVQGACHTRFA